MLTAPALFASVNPTGKRRCFYCGCPCDESNPTAAHVKDSFTDRASCVAPGSPFVCSGCVATMQEQIEINGRSGQRVRCYSWIVEAKSRRALTKANVDQLRSACLVPPEPPFAIVLADSGQKHLLYRGVVNHSREVVAVLLETERITYRPDALATRLDLCSRLIAATGKPALREPPSIGFAIRVCDYWTTGEQLLADWDLVWQEPLSRLAVWLSPKKEDCIREYPTDIIDRGVPAKAGGRGRSAAPGGQRRRKPDAEKRSDSLLFDPGETV